ncbi:hypothetical protein [Nonomuraea aurantiaca]|jgi:hypothetical protein|uniref:hypothetical protein n=1 Tax=Nonomuraea aurantiaca TaxID=2878562 RepID=UPI001CDA3A99|nr:hypothetical protein [Nonomuraea aurantiaca]MCA2225968.1 hypothetical protein [Nonomuraea aurantiaca]
MTIKVTSFGEIEDQFAAYIGDIVYATMTTVDAKGRSPAGPGTSTARAARPAPGTSWAISGQAPPTLSCTSCG